MEARREFVNQWQYFGRTSKLVACIKKLLRVMFSGFTHWILQVLCYSAPLCKMGHPLFLRREKPLNLLNLMGCVSRVRWQHNWSDTVSHLQGVVQHWFSKSCIPRHQLHLSPSFVLCWELYPQQGLGLGGKGISYVKLKHSGLISTSMLVCLQMCKCVYRGVAISTGMQVHWM